MFVLDILLLRFYACFTSFIAYIGAYFNPIALYNEYNSHFGLRICVCFFFTDRLFTNSSNNNNYFKNLAS